MVKNPIGPEKKNARLIVKKVHVNWDRSSASQLRCILTDADGAGSTALKSAESVAEECDVCAGSDRASRIPVAASPLASVFNGEIQADLLFSGNLFCATCYRLVLALSDYGDGFLEKPAGG